MFSNATLAPTIDCHQCVFPTPNFEVTDRVIVICSLPSPTPFDPYKSLEGQKKRQTQQVNNLLCAHRSNCKIPLPGKTVGISNWDGKRECYAHIGTHPAHWLGPEPCSFDLLRLLNRQQFKNSSQDTLHRRALLSFCFTYVLSAYIFSSYSCCVCRCGYFSQITVYIHIWPFVVLPLHVIAYL